MVFLVFLASVVAMEWIVRRQPGIRARNTRMTNAEDTIDAPATRSSADIACLANALAGHGGGAGPAHAAETVASKRTDELRNEELRNC